MEFDSICWNEDSKKELSMHSIHQYPAKFPAFIAAKSITYAKSLNPQLRVVADVFCGCGTSALEAKISGLDFYGIDIDPVAVLIARVKSSSYDAERLKVFAKKTTLRCEGLLSSCFIPKELANERIRYWYDYPTIFVLSALKRSIFDVMYKNKNERDAFLCVFSSILKPCSRWLAKSIKPTVDPNKKPADPISLFVKSAKRFIKSVSSFNKQMETASPRQSIIRIERSNVLSFKPRNKVDLIVSSPPYATSYEYADLHQLSTLWLGFGYDYKSFRSGSIGSSFNTDGFDSSNVKLNIIGDEIRKSLNGKQILPSRIKSLTRYYRDMEAVARKCYSFLKPGGLLVFVVGDTFIKNVPLRNSDHFVQALVDAGFKDVQKTPRQISRKNLTPYRELGGKFAKEDTGHVVYRNEYVITGRKQ